FYAQLGERRLRYVNAGHNAPYLFRAGRRSSVDGASDIEQLTVGGTVVGMFPEMGYEEATVELYPGDVLLAFTDGAPEPPPPAGAPEAPTPGGEGFGEGALPQFLR